MDLAASRKLRAKQTAASFLLKLLDVFSISFLFNGLNMVWLRIRDYKESTYRRLRISARRRIFVIKIMRSHGLCSGLSGALSSILSLFFVMYSLVSFAIWLVALSAKRMVFS
jgi:hypothetical protein